MPEIIITVSEKNAALSVPVTVVCGNSDYTVRFLFDSEWDAYIAKTARFTYCKNGVFRYEDVLFEGDSVSVPVLREADEVTVGVYAGDLHTTTPARVPCARCITDGAPVHDPPVPDVYDQLMEYLAGLQGGGSTAGQLTAIFGGTPPSPAGYATELGIVCKGTAASSAQFTVPLAGHFKLMVIALNSEASTFALDLAVQVNGSAVETEAVAYNAYSGSGTNRRNYRVIAYSANFSAGDTVQIDLTERSGYTSFVYALLDETYQFGSLMQTFSTADATASGSYSADAIALCGTFDGSAGGTVQIADAAAGTTVTTDNPGTNYKSAYIFWFEKEGS